MKSNLFRQASLLLAFAVAALGEPALAQDASGGGIRGATIATDVDRSMPYRGGSVVDGFRNVHFIFYGCWDSRGFSLAMADLPALTRALVTDLQIPKASNGIYVIFASSDIALSDGASSPASCDVYGPE